MTLAAVDARVKDTPHVKFRITALLAMTLLASCRHTGDITAENGGGIYAVRSACPIAGIPTGTGDITVFNPQGSTDSSAIDVSAAMTKLRAYCQDVGNDVVSTVTFTVTGLRRDAGPARQVVLPYFDVALRGGSTVSAKQIGYVALNFPAGSQHATTSARASVRVNRGAASLPANVRSFYHISVQHGTPAADPRYPVVQADHSHYAQKGAAMKIAITGATGWTYTTRRLKSRLRGRKVRLRGLRSRRRPTLCFCCRGFNRPVPRPSGSGATFGASSNREASQPVSFPLWGGTALTPPLRSHSR